MTRTMMVGSVVLCCVLSILEYTPDWNRTQIPETTQHQMYGGGYKTCSIGAGVCTACATHTTCAPNGAGTACTSAGGTDGCATAGGRNDCISGGSGCYPNMGGIACGGPREPVCMPSAFGTNAGGGMSITACTSSCNFAAAGAACDNNCMPYP